MDVPEITASVIVNINDCKLTAVREVGMAICCSDIVPNIHL